MRSRAARPSVKPRQLHIQHVIPAAHNAGVSLPDYFN